QTFASGGDIEGDDHYRSFALNASFFTVFTNGNIGVEGLTTGRHGPAAKSANPLRLAPNPSRQSTNPPTTRQAACRTLRIESSHGGVSPVRAALWKPGTSWPPLQRKSHLECAFYR